MGISGFATVFATKLLCLPCHCSLLPGTGTDGACPEHNVKNKQINDNDVVFIAVGYHTTETE